MVGDTIEELLFNLERVLLFLLLLKNTFYSFFLRSSKQEQAFLLQDFRLFLFPPNVTNDETYLQTAGYRNIKLIFYLHQSQKNTNGISMLIPAKTRPIKTFKFGNGISMLNVFRSTRTSFLPTVRNAKSLRHEHMFSS